MSFDEGLAVGRLMSGAGKLRRTVRDLEDDLTTVIAQRDQLAEHLRQHQVALASWQQANQQLQQQVADLERTIERERQDFQAQLKHERFERVLDGAVIAGKTAQVKAAGAEMRACPERHEMLEIDADGLQKGQRIYREAFDQDLRNHGVGEPEKYRT